jgi:hypothetical protein
LKKLVARDGIEPPTHGFSVHRPTPISSYKRLSNLRFALFSRPPKFHKPA